MRHLSRTRHLTRVAVMLILALGLSGCDAFVGTTERLERVTAAEQQGEWRIAMLELRQVLEAEPDHLDARIRLGNVLAHMGDGTAALTQLERARAAGAGRERWALPMARALLLLGEYERLLQELPPEAVAGADARQELLLLRAEAQIGSGALGEAEQTYARILSNTPGQAEALLGSARIAASRGDVALARGRARTAASTGDEARAWLLLGLLSAQAGDETEAQAALERAVAAGDSALAPDAMIRARVLLAQLLLRQGDAAADGQIEALLARAPDRPEPHYLQALQAYQSGDLHLARTALQRVLGPYPDHLPSLLLAGATAYGRGEFDVAVRHLQRYVYAVPSHLPARKLLASAELRLSRPEAALEVLEAAPGQTSDADAELLALVGEAALQAGQPRRAEQALREAAGANPQRSELRAGLARALMARGEYEAAARELEGLVAADREDLRAQLLLVSSYLAADQLEQARAAALERVRAQPEDPAWHTLLAAVENQSGAPAAARRALTQALELDADYLPARAILGRIELEAGQLAAAGVQYTRIVERQPGHLPSLMALARIAEHEGRTPDALAYLQRARRGHPDALLPRILQGVLFLRSGMPAEAVSVGREAVDIAPDDGRALALLAEAELAAGAPGEALPALRALAAQQPGNADVRAALARAFAATGRAREARIEFQQVLRLEPESAEARIGLGRIALQEGRAAEALEMAAALQRIIPERAYGYVLEGDARLLAQRPSEALPAYRAAWERDPSPELARQIARVQSQMGDDDAAVRSLQAARERYPDDGALGLSLAISLHASGREALAEAQYRGVLRADPDNVTALNNLAWLLHERGEHEALELARRAYALAPRSAAVTDTLGWLTLQGGDVVAGAELLERAARLQRLPSVLYHLAVARVEQGEPEAARALLEEALAAEAPFARADEARALLSAL